MAYLGNSYGTRVRSIARPPAAWPARRRFVVPPGTPRAQAARLKRDWRYRVVLGELTDDELNALALGDYDSIEGIKLKKLKKLVKKPLTTLAKVTYKATKAVAGKKIAAMIMPPGIKAKDVGAKDEKLFKKYQKKGMIAGAIVGAAVGMWFAGPLVLAALKSASSVVWGGVKFVGGKLVGASSTVLSGLKAKGKTPATATPEEVLQVAAAVGAIKKTDAPIVDGQVVTPEAVRAAGYTVPSAFDPGVVEQETPEGTAEAIIERVNTAGMFEAAGRPGISPALIGVGIAVSAAIALAAGRPKRSRA